MSTETPTQNNTPAEQTPQPSQETVAGGNEAVDIADLLGLPEETPEGEKKAEGAQQPPAKPEEGKTPDEGEANKPPVPGEGEPKPEGEEKEKSLKDVLQEVLAESRTKGEEKPEPEAKPQPEAEKPRYAPQIPDQLFAAIEHEDPQVRRQGLNALMGGAMSRVYHDLKKEMQAEMQAQLQRMPQVIQQYQQAQTEAETMRKTFYEENPNFGSSPKRMQLVAMSAIQLAQAKGKEYKGFTPEFRKELAAHLEELTGIKAGKVPPAAPGGTTQEKKKFNSGERTPTRGETQPTLSDEIADVVSLN